MRKRKLIRRRGVSTCALLLLGVMIGLLTVAGLARAAPPLAGSQVPTLEAAPDGLWLSQAWVLEWRGQPRRN